MKNYFSDIMKRINNLFGYLLIALLFMVFACGGGGGGGTGPNPVITFAPDSASPGDNSVYMAQNLSLSSGDVLAIDVKANNISGNVYGVAFDVLFDSSKTTYNGYTLGSFLESGGYSAVYQPSESSGRLVMGISRQGLVNGTSGSGTIVTLKLRVTGSSAVAFDTNRSNLLERISGTETQAIAGVSWHGGTAAAQ